MVLRGAVLAWCIWGERNQMVFRGNLSSHHIILARVHRLVEEQGSYVARIYPNAAAKPVTSPNKWSSPPPGMVKINADASLEVDGWVGIGVIARNSDGDVLFSASRRIRAYWTPEIAEAKAIAVAVRLGKHFGFKEVIFESDCQVVINRLSSNAIFLSDLDSILHEILSSSTFFSYVAWSHVKRDGNCVAHHLAKLVPFGVEQIWENHTPMDVAPYVLMDFLSRN
ncbi:uncharacterized protein LOC104882889 [Beta vulgaris subsp. vulgaris]|uniref:uncharacterized protein LOC104882889 n=1 Tax=Beta vulgaris subsp. vulgaris TaxID=3555 RepID=UPI00053F7FA7|nr:uncharacterized protein LOC104882889 [Beta vulgaris subsp. vulgaris]